jgi:aspartate carbamoyltransferase catalytic subunit
MHEFSDRDIISVRDFTRKDIECVLDTAEGLKSKPEPELLNGKVLGTLFFEPSTRTRLSFETAMQRLGGRVVGFSDASTTSTTKGETLKDTIRIVGQYADALVIRHPQDGAARAAAEATSKPVINAGDGANQHPTQSLLDLFTIRETQGTLENLKIAFCGDLKYGRTVHSLIEALTHFNPEIILISPPELALPKHYFDELDAHGIKHRIVQTLEEAIPVCDILYMTRIQKERFKDPFEYQKLAQTYELNRAKLTGAKPSMRVLHPLPRVKEINTEVDDTRHASYFEQAENGLFVRQALLKLILS